MKNKQPKNYLKLLTLFLGISLFFSSCERDEVIIETENINKVQSEFIIQNIELKDIDPNSEVFNKIQKLKNKTTRASKNSEKTKTIYSSDQDFLINTDLVKYIQNQDSTYHSYTFPIYRADNHSGLENLMLSYQEDGTYRTFIVTYNLTEQEVLDLNNGFSIDLKNKVRFVEFKDEQLVSNIFAKQNQQSTTIIIITEEPCTHPEHQDDHLSASCTHPTTSTSSLHISNTSNVNQGLPDPTGEESPTNNNYGGGVTAPTSATKSQLLNLFSSEIEADISLMEGEQSYRTKISAVGQYFNILTENGRKAPFSEMQQMLDDVSSNASLSLNDLTFIWQKTKQVYDILNTKKSQIGNLDNLDGLDSILSQQDMALIESNLTTVAFLPHVKTLIGEHWPQNAEQWSAIGTIMGQFLLEIGLAVIPGSSIVDVVAGIDDGDYIAVSIGIAGIIVDAFGGTILKVIGKIGKVAYKTFKIFKAVFKYLNEVKKSITLGFKTLLDGDKVKLLNKSDEVIGEIVSNVLNVSFKGFGGDLISHPSKTTTIIGKFLKDQPNGTDALIKTGLTESITGISNKTTFNVLNDPNFLGWPSNKAWLDDAIKRGDVIRMISDPNVADGFFKQEIDYLISNGYKISGAYLVK